MLSRRSVLILVVFLGFIFQPILISNLQATVTVITVGEESASEGAILEEVFNPVILGEGKVTEVTSEDSLAESSVVSKEPEREDSMVERPIDDGMFDPMMTLNAVTDDEEDLIESDEQIGQFNGSFTTRIPIEVPPYHGIEPNLALVYNSTNKNGWTGWGWIIQGMSYIERARPNGGAPQYDSTDAFFLDGMELVPSTVLGGTHCTEIQSYKRIIYDSPTDSWSVWNKDGRKLKYSLRYNTINGTFRWYLSTVEDAHGNIVTTSHLKIILVG